MSKLTNAQLSKKIDVPVSELMMAISYKRRTVDGKTTLSYDRKTTDDLWSDTTELVKSMEQLAKLKKDLEKLEDKNGN